MHESKAGGEHSYDLPGTLTATLGLLSLVYGFTKAAQDGWATTSTLYFFGIAIILLVAFFLIQKNVKNPLLPLRIITERNRGGSYLGSMMVGAGLFSMFLFLGLYLQVILGYSPLRTGFAFLPFSIGIILFAGVASQLLPRVGPKPLIIWGLIQATVGLYLLTFITPETAYLTHVLPSLLIMSTGMALVFIPISTTALHGIGGRDSGVASAALNTSQQVGGSLGTALLNTIAATSAANYLINNPGLGDKAQVFALTHGYTASFKAGAAMLIVAAIVMMVFIKVGKESLVEKE